MHQILHIFRKDARRLRYEITVVLLLTLLFAWNAGHKAPNSLRYGASDFLAPVLGALLPFAWWYLSALAVYGEPLVGDRQFWLTRPYSRSSLLLSKLLFLLAFLTIPTLAADALILAWQGFPPLGYLPQILYHSLALTLVFALPALAIAALTSGLAQLIVWIIGGFVSISIVVALMTFPVWGFIVPQTEWVRTSASALVLVLGSVAVLVVQYVVRRTIAARLLAGLAASGALALALWMPGAWALKVQRQVRPVPAGYETGSLVHASAVWASKKGGAPDFRELPYLSFSLPVTGASPASHLIINRVYGEVLLKNRNRLRVSSFGGGFPGGSLDLYCCQDDGIVRDAVSLHVQVFATLVEEDRAVAGALPSAGQDGAFGAQRCRFYSGDGFSDRVVCRAPFQPAGFLVEWGHEGFSPDWSAPDSYSPLPARPNFLPVFFNGGYLFVTHSLQIEQGPPVVFHPQRVVPLRVLGHFRREFDIPLVAPAESPVRR